MTATLQFDQDGLPPGTPGQSRDDIVAGLEVRITNVNPGGTNSLEMLFKPFEDDTSVLGGDPAGVSTITPKAGTDGTWEFLLTVDGDITRHTFTILTPKKGVHIGAPNELANPNTKLSNVDAEKIEESSTNKPVTGYPSGSPWGWFPGYDRNMRILENLEGTEPSIQQDLFDNDSTYIIVGDKTEDKLVTVNYSFQLPISGRQRNGVITLSHDGSTATIDEDYYYEDGDEILSVTFGAAISGDELRITIVTSSVGENPKLVYRREPIGVAA